MVHSGVLLSLVASLSLSAGKVVSEEAVDKLQYYYTSDDYDGERGTMTTANGVDLPDRDDFHYYAPQGWPLADADDHVVPQRLQWMFNNCPSYATNRFACKHECSSPQVFYIRMCQSHVGGACSEPWCEETAKQIQAEYPLCRCPDWPGWKLTYTQLDSEGDSKK